MMELSWRIILLCAAVVLVSIPMISKGRGPSIHDGHAAFLPFTSESVIIKVGGNVSSRGMYAFREGDTVATVINMTIHVNPDHMPDKSILKTRLHRGDVIELSHGPLQQPVIQMKSMKAREKMLLGIPLNPDQMDYDDWRSLPGIGPVLAQRILDSRQNNGDYGSLEAVRRVKGIGGITCEKLRKYF